MSFDKKKPPIRIRISGTEFNKILNIMTNDDKDVKDKLMKYTFTHEDNQVELRLFPHETECIFLLLLKHLSNIDIHYDYYDELKNNRIEYRKNLEKGGDLNA
ncbi:MAG: hypothetical protein E7170_04110 [Firmicutes bacterium]|nr:hypothetical protein [Bacillota bacterium]